MKRPDTKTVRHSDFSEYRIAEFWSRVRILPNGCMVYHGEKNPSGYGRVEMKGRTSRSHRRCGAHRAAYAMTWGECPAMPLLHSCDNPACVNPCHLTPGTQAQNVADMVSRGRHRFFGHRPKSLG